MAKSKRVKIPRSLVDTFVRVWNKENNDSRLCEERLNCGWCYQFAVVIKQALDAEVNIYSDLDGGHCWVKIGDYFYDSEHLNGTRRLLSMSSNGDWKGPVSIKVTQSIWRGANSGPVQLDTISKVVEEWKRCYSK